MSLCRSKVFGMRAAVMFCLLGMVAMPVWAGEKQGVMTEKERTARIQEFHRERARVEGELDQLLSEPGGTARSTVPRSEFSDQPTKNIKASLESVPGVSARQGSSGRDVLPSIRGSK